MSIQFDPKKLLKSSGLNPKDKIQAAVVKKASGMTSKLSGAVASKLASAGQSLKTASAFSAAKTDALLSAAPAAFTTMAALGGGSPAIERIARGALVNGRMGDLSSFDPQTVIPRNISSSGYSETRVYPSDLGDMDYRIIFDFMEYKRPSVAEAPQTEIRFSICLPIPNTLLETYGVGYSEGKYGATLGNVLNQMSNPNNPDASTEATGIGLARGAGQSNIARAAAGLGSVVGLEAESLSGAFDQAMGSIVNPHLALFFNGPTMREHQFFWTVSPRNQNDTRNLKEIYYRIKRSALPTFTPNASHTTLEYPMMARVRVMTKGNQELYPFKMCVISNIVLNHAAAGTPAFMVDGQPSIQQLSMSLKEIEYFTSNDIQDIQGAPYAGFEADFTQNQVAYDEMENYFQTNVLPAIQGIIPSGGGEE